MDISFTGILFDLADFIIHIDRHLQVLASQYGLWLYGILFLIVFCETGLVVTPFLPGDSLLFAAGSIAAMPDSSLEPNVLFLVFFSAALLGDNLNYAVGRFLGRRVQDVGHLRLVNPGHIEKTRHFFEKYGGKTIIIARFMPIVRTFTPFVAGVGAMAYARFILFSIFGALLWVGAFTYSGYYFGRLPFVQHNFKFLILGIIVVSLLPPAVEYIKHRAGKAAR